MLYLHQAVYEGALMERKKRSKKTALVLLAVTLLVICLGYWVYRRTFATPAGRERVQVRRGTLTAIVEAMGEVQPAHEVWLSLKVSGTIARIYVNVGDVVSKGDTLLELETTALQRRVREAELNLEIRQLQLAKLKAPWIKLKWPCTWPKRNMTGSPGCRR